MFLPARKLPVRVQDRGILAADFNAGTVNHLKARDASVQAKQQRGQQKKDFCCREIAHDADGELPVVHFCLWGEAQPAALPGSIHRGDEQIFSAPGVHAVKNQLYVKRPVCESLFDGEDKVDQSAKPQAV